MEKVMSIKIEVENKGKFMTKIVKERRRLQIL